MIRRRRPIARKVILSRTSRPRRQRKSTLACLKRKFWSLFSAYVKERDGNVCFSCGASGLEGPGWHAGHLFTAGAHAVIRFEPKNVHSQCFRCNVNLGGNGAAYAERFIETYGIEEFRRLSAMSRQMKQWRAPEILELMDVLKRGGADFEMFYAERYGLNAAIAEALAKEMA